MNRRRKHILQTKEKDIQWPQENRHFAKALGSRGDNLVEVEFEDGSSSLVLLPARFNKKLWIRSGTFLIVELPQVGDAPGGKARISGTIEDVLYKDDIDHLRRQNFWPAAFETKPSKAEEAAAPEMDSDSDNSSDGDRSPLQPNNNRPNISYFDLEDSDSDAEGSDR